MYKRYHEKAHLNRLTFINVYYIVLLRLIFPEILMAKRKQPKFYKTKLNQMGTGEKLTGEQYSRRTYAPTEHYRMDFKTDAYKKWIIEYVKKSEKWKGQLKTISKCPDREFRSTRWIV